MNQDDQKLFETLIRNPHGRAKLQDLAKSLDNNSYEDFLDVLYKKLRGIFIKLEHSRDKYFSHDEDAITGVIAGRLEEAGYYASEQTKQNGAVDLTVKLGDHKWIAEAKIAYSNSKILEGLLQLLTRYAARDKSAGLFIYIKKVNSKKVVDDWKNYIDNSKGLKAYISNKNTEVKKDIEHIFKNVEVNCVENLLFTSKHNLVSGEFISVQHFGADLYFNPTDSSGNKGKKQREENALNNLANLYFLHLESGGSDFDNAECIKYLERLFRELDPDDVKVSNDEVSD